MIPTIMFSQFYPANISGLNQFLLFTLQLVVLITVRNFAWVSVVLNLVNDARRP
jgi:hypothetical protein